MDPKHLLVEAGVLDWTRETGGDTRRDEIDAGQVLLHLGLDDRTEVQLAWTAFGTVRTRAAGKVERETGVGNVTVALRRGLAGANGPVAVQPYVTLPAGGTAIGLGDYSAGVLLPVVVPLSESFTIQATPEVDWLPDSASAGHHLSYGSAFGVVADLTKSVAVAIEGDVMRDNDPNHAMTSEAASASIAWQPGDHTQLDFGVVKGVRNAPDVELYIGYSRRF